MPDGPTVVLVGHCGPDMFMLRTAVSRVVPEAAIEVINDGEMLDDHLVPGVLLLVNRELDGLFGSTSGIDLIREIAAAANAPATMLVSNFPEAQEEAVAAGARPGFGKAQLYDAQTAERIREALA